MKIGIYCIKDNVAGFLQPTFDLSEPAALRNFSYAVSQPSQMNFKPEDFSLWSLGDFDTETGVISPCDPRLIVHATEVIKK